MKLEDKMKFENTQSQFKGVFLLTRTKDLSTGAKQWYCHNLGSVPDEYYSGKYSEEYIVRMFDYGNWTWLDKPKSTLSDVIEDALINNLKAVEANYHTIMHKAIDDVKAARKALEEYKIKQGEK